jgi:hypothetical protein
LDIRKSTEIVKRFDREGFILILLVHSLWDHWFIISSDFWDVIVGWFWQFISNALFGDIDFFCWELAINIWLCCSHVTSLYTDNSMLNGCLGDKLNSTLIFIVEPFANFLLPLSMV